MSTTHSYCTRSKGKAKAAPDQCAASPPCQRKANSRRKHLLKRDRVNTAPKLSSSDLSSPTLPEAVGELLEVYMTEQRGRGIRTARAEIPQGTILYSEDAALRGLPCFYHERKKLAAERIRQVVATDLDQTQRRKFFALAHPSGDNSEEARFQINCFENRNARSIRRAGSKYNAEPEDIRCTFNLWLDLAMINHSCRPNAVVLVSGPDQSRADLIAVTDLPVKGTEITISYINGEEEGCKDDVRASRQRLLKKGWHFVCACDACESPGITEPHRKRRTSSTNIDDRSLNTDGTHVEMPDDRLDYLHFLAEQLGLLESETHQEAQPDADVEIFERFFSQYEALLRGERMVYRLCYAHQKALDVYRAHWLNTNTKQDELTFARILYHREQLTKYTRICWGPEAACKSALEYAAELKGTIKRPKRKRSETYEGEEATRKDKKRRRTSPRVERSRVTPRAVKY